MRVRLVVTLRGPAFLASGIWKSVELVVIDTVLIDECSVVVTKVTLTLILLLTQVLGWNFLEYSLHLLPYRWKVPF